MGQLSVFVLLSILYRLADCFWRRRYHSCNYSTLQSVCDSFSNSHEQAVLAGNWIYIDGGDIMNQEGRYLRNNETYGLDLSKNWSNASSAITRTTRPANATSLSGQALWFDEKQNLIYDFGGFRTYALYSYDPTPVESMWAFTPDEKGAGSWREVLGPTGTDAFPSDIKRPFLGGYCSDERYGYYVGGYRNTRSTPSLETDFNIISRGLLKFDFGNLTITNTYDGNFARSQSFEFIAGSGKLVNVPTYGAGGILILLSEGDPNTVVSFNNVTIYDKIAQKWYSQLASGDIPEPRSDFCIVGIQSTVESGNFEIFMYGGVVNYKLGPNAENSDQVYVLSLPAFQWFKAIYPPGYSRALHTCHKTHTNQMIIVGGVDPRSDTHWVGEADMRAEAQDPWPEGIGIFDMTTLKFKNFYEANAKQYETPESIKGFYNDKSKRYPAQWNSPAVKEIFQPTKSPSQLSAGSIGGIAAGVTVAVVAIVAITISILKRRTKKAKLSPTIFGKELPDDERHELHPSANLPELANKHGGSLELANTGITELFDTSRRDRLEMP